MPEILLGVLIAAVIVPLLLWPLFKAVWRAIVGLWNDVTGETARTEILEEKARAEDEERRQRGKERQRQRRQAEAAAREQFRAENAEVFAGIEDVLSTCATPAVEIMRAEGAIEGEHLERDPKFIVWLDIGLILASMSKTGDGIVYIHKLWKEVTRAIRPPDVKGTPSLDVVPNRGVQHLLLIPFLVKYDEIRGTILSSKAASVYCRIVTTVYDHGDGSLAAKMVADKYLELLAQYLPDSGGNEHAARSATSLGSCKSVCRKCGEAFGLLGLRHEASEDDVKQKRRAWAEVLHPDQLGSKTEKARSVAENQLKSINEACDQILRCRCAFSTR